VGEFVGEMVVVCEIVGEFVVLNVGDSVKFNVGECEGVDVVLKVGELDGAAVEFEDIFLNQ
jgi:hypothetical protein